MPVTCTSCRFAVIAPDSHQSLYWYNSKPGQPFTTDWEHVEACYQYVKNLQDVMFNPRYTCCNIPSHNASGDQVGIGKATDASH